VDVTATRPDFAPGYGIATGDESGLLDWSWAAERLEAARNYWIVTTRPDGRPHAAPVWGAWTGGALYFGTDPDSVKARSLAHQPWVVAHLESGDEVVIVEGRIDQGVDPDTFERVNDGYAAKYVDPDTGEPFRLGAPTAPGLWALRPAVAFGWLESDFVRTATRWHFGPSSEG